MSSVALTPVLASRSVSGVVVSPSAALGPSFTQAIIQFTSLAWPVSGRLAWDVEESFDAGLTWRLTAAGVADVSAPPPIGLSSGVAQSLSFGLTGTAQLIRMHVTPSAPMALGILAGGL